MEYKHGKVLEGVRILDLTQYLSGPFCTLCLADFGADVILVERPDRQVGSGPFLNGERVYTLSTFRGKRGITLNLKDSKDKELFFRLVKVSDVVIENFRPGVMEKMGLGYENCKKHKPDIIFASISGFGGTGPYKDKGAMDVIIQAMSGLMALTGEPDGHPTKIGPSISDMLAGLYCTIAIMGALYYKKCTGVGQFIDIAMLDCSFACLENAVANYYATGKVPSRVGNRHQTSAPFQNFKTSDGEIYIAVSRNPIFVRMCNALGAPELAANELFVTTESRRRNLAALEKSITEITSKMTMKEIEAALDKAKVPVGRVNTIDQIVNDPQIQERKMILELSHPVAGSYKVAGNPIKMSETTPFNVMPAPVLGQHTAEVFKELLGMSDKQIQEVVGRHAAIQAQAK